jgi:hypothetical protein
MDHELVDDRSSFKNIASGSEYIVASLVPLLYSFLSNLEITEFRHVILNNWLLIFGTQYNQIDMLQVCMMHYYLIYASMPFISFAKFSKNHLYLLHPPFYVFLELFCY